MKDDNILDHLPKELITAAYQQAKGNEIDSGKFQHPESSAALAGNAFGFFLEQPGQLPPIPGTETYGWPAVHVAIEQCVRLPWSGGTHPWLDAFIETQSHIIGVESKRYEQFRGKPPGVFSDAYWRDVWGDHMNAYQRARDGLANGEIRYQHLDAFQLVKHALGLFAEGERRKKMPILLYVFAEPPTWSDDREIPVTALEAHRAEVEHFAQQVAGGAVAFVACPYRQLLMAWESSGSEQLARHALLVKRAFNP